MRVSQVEIEPVLQRALQAEPGVTARWGVAFDDLCADDEGVTATLCGAEGGTERVRSATWSAATAAEARYVAASIFPSKANLALSSAS